MLDVLLRISCFIDVDYCFRNGDITSSFLGSLAIKTGLQGCCRSIIAAHPLHGFFNDETGIAAPHDQVAELLGSRSQIDFQSRLVERINRNPVVLIPYMGEEDMLCLQGSLDLDRENAFTIGYGSDRCTRHGDMNELKPFAVILVAHQSFDGNIPGRIRIHLCH